VASPDYSASVQPSRRCCLPPRTSSVSPVTARSGSGRSATPAPTTRESWPLTRPASQPPPLPLPEQAERARRVRVIAW